MGFNTDPSLVNSARGGPGVPSVSNPLTPSTSSPGPGYQWNPTLQRWMSAADFQSWQNGVNTAAARSNVPQSLDQQNNVGGASAFKDPTPWWGGLSQLPGDVLHMVPGLGSIASGADKLGYQPSRSDSALDPNGSQLAAGIPGSPGYKGPGSAAYTAANPSTVPGAPPPPALPGAPAPGSVSSGAAPTSALPPPASPPGAAGITPEIQSMLQRFQPRPVPGIAPVTVGQNQQAVGAAPTAGTSAAGVVNQGASNQTRNQQEQNIGDLFAASRGLVPSAAEIQLKQATDRNVANQLGLAAALQGRSVGGALKQASETAGSINAQAAGDAATLRANEQAAARTALSNALYGVRQGDITPEITNAQLTNATGIANAGNVTTSNIAGANNATSASQTNANNSTTLVGKQADINQQTATDNITNMLKARGLDDDQIAKFMQSLVTSKGQDLGFTTDTQRNLIAQQLGLGGLDVQRQQLALAASQQDWNKAKDVLGAVGTGAAAVGSSQWFQNLLNGTSSNSSTASGFTPGVDSGPGTTGIDTSSDGQIDPSQTPDNPLGTG